MAQVDGGALYCKGKTTLIDSNFTKNIVFFRFANLRTHCGGAVLSKGSLSIDGCRFDHNDAHRGHGGAIYADTITSISNSVFSWNSARKQAVAGCGGAIYVDTIEKISNTSFLYNRATLADGGAIYVNKKCNLEIYNCVFYHNLAGEKGGAIYLDSTNAHLTLKNSNLVGNKADGSGQTVYNCGYYDAVEYNWHGINNPNINDQFKEYHRFGSDSGYRVLKYVNTNIKVNSTVLYVGDTYNVRVYLTGNNNEVLKDQVPGITVDYPEVEWIGYKSYPRYVSWSNKEHAFNEFSADVRIESINSKPAVSIDDQWFDIKVPIKDKMASSVEILSSGDAICIDKGNVILQTTNNGIYTCY